MIHSIEHETLFLIRLSKHDFDKFNKHPFSYSGSTGAGAVDHPEWYPSVGGAYIATCMSELLPALRTFGWKSVTLQHRDGAWFAEHCQVS